MSEPMQHISDRELWDAFEAGDSQAFGKLYHRHYKKLFAYCYSYLKNKEDARDMVNEIFTKILDEGKQPGSSEIQSMEGWFMAFARFYCHSSYRKQRNRERIDKQLDYARPVSWEYHPGMDANRIHACIDKVSNAKYREILRLTAKGYNNDEIAEAIGRDKNWVRRRKCEARKELKNILKKGGLVS